MAWATGGRVLIRRLRAALNRRSAQRGTTIGGPDFLPTEVADDGDAPGWTVPVPDPVDAGTLSALELPEPLPPRLAALLDGLDGRPRLADLLAEDQLPEDLRTALQERRAARIAAKSQP
jgi:hypothetical protein